jgi:hypothetical protein
MVANDSPERVEASQGYRDWVLSLLRSFTPSQPLMVSRNVMREAVADPDLCQLVAEGLIVETPMLATR